MRRPRTSVTCPGSSRAPRRKRTWRLFPGRTAPKRPAWCVMGQPAAAEGLFMGSRVVVVVIGVATALATARGAHAARCAPAASTLSVVACADLPTEPTLDPAYRKPLRLSSARASTAGCRATELVFYAARDWLRLASKLAERASPCSDYYVSIPPLVADKTNSRPNQAWRIRALGPRFHAMAEIHWSTWQRWARATGRSWHDAGVEARRRMAAAGYDVDRGDIWAVNELPSSVRRDLGTARDDARTFLGTAYTPIANAGWQWPSGLGWTMLTGDQMRHFVSSQTYALRSYAAGRPGTDRFGFAWAPNNESGMPSARFVAETGSVLDRLGAALSESGAEWPIDPGLQACQSLGADWCVAGVPGAVFTDAW